MLRHTTSTSSTPTAATATAAPAATPTRSLAPSDRNTGLAYYQLAHNLYSISIPQELSKLGNFLAKYSLNHRYMTTGACSYSGGVRVAPSRPFDGIPSFDLFRECQFEGSRQRRSNGLEPGYQNPLVVAVVNTDEKHKQDPVRPFQFICAVDVDNSTEELLVYMQDYKPDQPDTFSRDRKFCVNDIYKNLFAALTERPVDMKKVGNELINIYTNQRPGLFSSIGIKGGRKEIIDALRAETFSDLLSLYQFLKNVTFETNASHLLNQCVLALILHTLSDQTLATTVPEQITQSTHALVSTALDSFPNELKQMVSAYCDSGTDCVMPREEFEKFKHDTAEFRNRLAIRDSKSARALIAVRAAPAASAAAAVDNSRNQPRPTGGI
jgi:hypothetical protein